jgi:hypothetical protein
LRDACRVGVMGPVGPVFAGLGAVKAKAKKGKK